MAADAAEPRLAIGAIITGRVQGVGYRQWTAGEATRLGLDGFVRNRRDGSVEALFAGPGTAVRAMLELCRQGPAAARVEAVVEQLAESPLSDGLLILATA